MIRLFQAIPSPRKAMSTWSTLMLRVSNSSWTLSIKRHATNPICWTSSNNVLMKEKNGMSIVTERETERQREIFHLGLEFDDVQVSSILRWIYFGRCMAMEGLLDGKRSVWHLCKFRKIFCLIFNVSDYRIWPYINNFCLEISKIIVGPHFICLYLKLREITLFHFKLYYKLHFAL